MSRRWFSGLILSVMLYACADAVSPAVPCEGEWGDFPPSACGILVARAGNVVPGSVVMVIGPRNSISYLSDVAHIDSTGDFSFRVLQYNGFGTVDDTVLITIGVFPSVEAISFPDPEPDAAAEVRLQIAPIGARVDTTHAGVLAFQ